MSIDGETLAKARDAWFRSEDGERCLEGTATGQYLRNRLERAFLAGAALADGHPLADKMMANEGPGGGEPEGDPLTDAQLDACQDCGATGQALYEKSNHHGGTKRVCADRDACHIRRPG